MKPTVDCYKASASIQNRLLKGLDTKVRLTPARHYEAPKGDCVTFCSSCLAGAFLPPCVFGGFEVARCQLVLVAYWLLCTAAPFAGARGLKLEEVYISVEKTQRSLATVQGVYYPYKKFASLNGKRR